jgi:hypothetical protein
MGRWTENLPGPQTIGRAKGLSDYDKVCFIHARQSGVLPFREPPQSEVTIPQSATGEGGGRMETRGGTPLRDPHALRRRAAMPRLA